MVYESPGFSPARVQLVRKDFWCFLGTVRLQILLIGICMSAALSGSPSIVGPSTLLQSSSCTSRNVSIVFLSCVIEGSITLRSEASVITHYRLSLRGQQSDVATTFNFCDASLGCSSDESWYCGDEVLSPHLAPPPGSTASTPTLQGVSSASNNSGSDDMSVTSGNMNPQIDFASLSQIFDVPQSGRVAIVGLHLTGVILGNASSPASFLSLSVFRLPSTAFSSSTGQSPSSPALILGNVVITTPSCSTLSRHQAFACRSSPSPNFTVTPSSLIVHRYTTPTACLTNVTLLCSGTAVPYPCLARIVSSGSEAMEAIRTMQNVVSDNPSSSRVPMPAFLYLQQDMQLPSSDPTSAQPATIRSLHLKISGAPDGRTVLNLADSVNLIRLVQNADPRPLIELQNLTIRDPPATLASNQSPYTLLRLFLWTFDFERLIVGGASVFMVRSIRVVVPPEEMAFWFSEFTGNVPKGLDASMCVSEGHKTMPSRTVTIVTKNGCPSLLIEVGSTMGNNMVFQNVTLLSDNDTWCCTNGMSMPNSLSNAPFPTPTPTPTVIDLNARLTPGESGTPSPPGAPAASYDATACPWSSEAETAAVPPLCLTTPVGWCGTATALNNMVKLHGRLNVQYLVANQEYLPTLLGVMDADVVQLMWPRIVDLRAVITKPSVLLGSAWGLTVTDVALLPAAIALAGSNASVTIRNMTLINLPAAGLYPGPSEANPMPNRLPRLPAVSSPPRPPPFERRLGRSLTRAEAVASPRGGAAAAALRDHHWSGGTAAWESRPSDLQQGGVQQGRGVRAAQVAKPFGRRLQAAAAAPEVAPVTQGLPSALTNFTSCLWLLDFDRAAAAAAASQPASTGDPSRPPGLPYVFLDSVVLLISQPELDLLAWVWAVAANTMWPHFNADPGLAGQLVQMLEGSRLSAETDAVVRAMALAVHLASSGAGTGTGTVVATLTFVRFTWCGLRGRNVTLTAQLQQPLPNLETGLPPDLRTLQLDLPAVNMVEHPIASAPPAPSAAAGAAGGCSTCTSATLVIGIVFGSAGFTSLLAVVMFCAGRRLPRGLACGTKVDADPVTAETKEDSLVASGLGPMGLGEPDPHKKAAFLAGEGSRSGSFQGCAVRGVAKGKVNGSSTSDPSSNPEAVALGGMGSGGGGRNGGNNDGGPHDDGNMAPPGLSGRSSFGSSKGPASSAQLEAAMCQHPPPSPVQPKHPCVASTTPAARQHAQRTVPSVRQHVLNMYAEMHLHLQNVLIGRTTTVPPSSSHPLRDAGTAFIGIAEDWADGRAADARPSYTEADAGTQADSSSDKRLEVGSGSVVLRLAADSSPGGDLTSSPPGQDDSLLVVRGELGRGAQGVVYRGVWRGLDVAVKSVLLQGPVDPSEQASPHARACPLDDYRIRAVREATISTSISHPNVVATYTYTLQPLGEERQPGTQPGASSRTVVQEVWKLTLVQELCDANSLRHCLERGTLSACKAVKVPGVRTGAEQRKLTVLPAPSQATATQAREGLLELPVVLMVVLQVARGLAHLHDNAIVHADVSSANVLIKSVAQQMQQPQPTSRCCQGMHPYVHGTAGEYPYSVGTVEPFSYGYTAKVCDFGLSERLAVEGDATHLSGPARRSSAYSAPELVRHGRAGPAGDVYALAVVLWEISNGCPLPVLLSRASGARVATWLAQQALLDPQLAGALPPGLLCWPAGVPEELLQLAGECLREDPRARPLAREVVIRLEAMTWRMWTADEGQLG